MYRFLFLISLVILASCDSHIEWSDGQYKVQWIDTKENRKLGYVLDDGFWIQRIGKTIASVGSDEYYIVIKRYDAETGLVEYFYIDKALDRVESDLSPGVFGPYDKNSFSEISESKKLPKISIDFE